LTRQRCLARICNVTVAEPSRASGVTVERYEYGICGGRAKRTTKEGKGEGRIDMRMEITEEGEVYVKTGGADNNA
jgi:hypothetical protein